MLVGTARGSEGHSGALCGIWGKKDGKKNCLLNKNGRRSGYL